MSTIRSKSVGIPLADIAGGLFACIGILGALVGKLLDGTGQHLDVAMLAGPVAGVRRAGRLRRHRRARGEVLAPPLRRHRPPGPQGRPPHGDNLSRVANRLFTVGVLEEAFLSRTKAEWMTVLDRYDIPASPVNDLPAVFSDPQVLARGLVQTYDHPTLGPIRYTPSPMQFSAWRRPNISAPMLGQHTREVLHERLGYDDATVDGLVADGVTTVWPA